VRVVFLTHNYPRWPGDLSGAFLATLAAALVRRGIEVRVVAPSDAGQGGDEVRDGVAVRRVRYAAASRETLAYRGTMASAVSSVGGLTALGGLWRAMRRAAREEIEAGADLVHAHWWIPGGLAVPRDVPFVLTSHGTDAALLNRSKIARRLAAPVYHRADVVTAVSKELATWIQNGVGRHIGTRHVYPMPVDATRFGWSVGGGGAFVISRLVAQKRVHLAIEATACLVDLGTELPLTIVGDGPERDALERLADTRGVRRLVRFVGAVPPERIPEALSRADVMYFPAEGEGFGLVAAEAFMAGVPVVACWDGGGVLDVVPDRGAGRRTLPQPDALADAALDLVMSRTREEDIRREGERWRRRLAPDRVAEVCEGWYREALGDA
jgi:glycosyltransferase involved in cell wall biosynthesis